MTYNVFGGTLSLTQSIIIVETVGLSECWCEQQHTFRNYPRICLCFSNERK